MQMVINMRHVFSKEPRFNLNHARDEHFTPYAMHTHSFAELYCFLEGKGSFRIEGTRYPLEPGDILLMRPGEAHYIEIDPDCPYERIVVGFDPALLESLEPGNALLQPYFDRKAGSRNLYKPDPVCTGYLLAMAEPDSSRAIGIANLVLLLQRLCRRFLQSADQALPPDSLEQQVICYINQNLHRAISTEELCRQFYLSRPQLCRRFHAATGTSIGRYITAKRMVQARQLLLQGQKPTQVYACCGYRDYTTFFRAYKSFFGHSPREVDRFPLSEEQHILV